LSRSKVEDSMTRCGAISRASNLRVAGSSSGWTPPRSGLGQATCTCVPLSPISISWYWSKGSDVLRMGM